MNNPTTTEVMEHPTIQMPHCDQLVLHSPGTCEACDLHPEWQAYRAAAGIAFSDMPAHEVQAHGLVPCPSTYSRSAEVRDAWNRNQPVHSLADKCNQPLRVFQTGMCGRSDCGIVGQHTHMG